MTSAQTNETPQKETGKKAFSLPFFLIPVSFFLVELFAFLFLNAAGDHPIWQFFLNETPVDWATVNWWPLAFGILWAAMLTGIVRAMPNRLVSRIVYGIGYFLPLIYAAVQTGYFLLFKQMLWLSDFRYASEGSDYFSVLLEYPLFWWLCLILMIAFGVILIVKFPRRNEEHWVWNAVGALTAVMAICLCMLLPDAVFVHDKEVRYAGSDYGRAQSAEAAYENMFNCHRLYQVCGVFQTAVKDVYANFIYPITPGYAGARAAAREEIDSYFEKRGQHQPNEMTGIFEGKNVILVLMESMDDWAIGEHTPTICRLMDEGINFTNFYTPGYGGVRTFNSEFCANTGSFLASTGGYAFDYVTNNFDQSLANQLKKLGYSAKTYHYNDPNFYSRGVFEPAMGYDEYVCYADYSDPTDKWALYDEEFLFNHAEIAEDFLRDGPKLNYIITRSAHLSYKYNEMLSYYALKKYPDYRGLTGSEEEDCMYVKAKIVDDLFARLIAELEADGELENTVIVAFTDHYTYGMDDQQLVMDRSEVTDALLVEKTPCFIWTPGGPDLEVTKTLNTADLLPTVLNLMGVETQCNYLGQDAFDDNYVGYALFPNGSWVSQGIAYNVSDNHLIFLSDDAPTATAEFQKQMSDTVMDFIRINNLILETDYYEQ